MKKYITFYILVSTLSSLRLSYGVGESPASPAGAIELVTLPKRESVQVTIYNSADLTLVREKRNLTLKRGWNWLQLMWANTLIDPTSINLEPKDKKNQIDIQALVFPPGQIQLGRWLIRSEFSGQVPFDITYLTSGLGWRAFYMGTLSEDEKSMEMRGYVRVSNNSGEDYENAHFRLISGQVHMLDKITDLARRQYPYLRPGLSASDVFNTVSFNGDVSLKPDVGWWKLDDGKGMIAKDSSGMGNDGKVNNPNGGLGIHGNVWVNDPERGIVASFNGNDSTGAYISAGSIPAMNLTNDFTWAFWAKVLTSAEGAQDNDVIVGNRFRPEGWPYKSSDLMFIKFTPTMFEYYSSSNEGIKYPPLNISPDSNKWIRHVVVKKGNTLTYYRNGVQTGISTLRSSINVINPFYIGGDEQGERVACYISDVRLWNKALTIDEANIVMQDLAVTEASTNYFLYTIEGSETIENNWSKRLLSFDSVDVNVINLYKYDYECYGDSVIRFLSFKNDKKHNLGFLPIPGGMFKVYRDVDEEGHLSYEGLSEFTDILVNEEVECNLGSIANVKVEPVLMDFKTNNYMYGSNNEITGWDEIHIWKIKISNTRSIPVTIEITRDFGTNYWTLKSETPYDKYDVTKIRFNLNLEPASKREIEYIVTTYQGTRQDQFNKQIKYAN